MTITEKNLAEKLAGIYGDTNDYDWAMVARTAAELLGVDLAPEPKPLPVEPGSVIIATEVRGVKGEWLAFLLPYGKWASAEPISGHHWHRPGHITAWTEARVVPAGEQIDPNDVRAGDRVRLALDNGDEITTAATCVDRRWFVSHHDAYDRHTIRSVYLLHREEA